MTQYLGTNKFYVENKEAKLVYMVNEYETNYNSAALYIHLELVAGWDYVNPDYNNIQGWCPAERFIEDVHLEIIPQYFLKEGTEEALEENGYTILKVEDISPNLKTIIDKHNEA